MQRKATQAPLPFGFPIVQDKKWESLETRLWLKQQGFLFPFSVPHNWQCHMREKRESVAVQVLVGRVKPALLGCSMCWRRGFHPPYFFALLFLTE